MQGGDKSLDDWIKFRYVQASGSALQALGKRNYYNGDRQKRASNLRSMNNSFLKTNLLDLNSISVFIQRLDAVVCSAIIQAGISFRLSEGHKT